MRVEDVRKAITPLHLVFAGALLCLVDVDYVYTRVADGTGWQIDLVSDAVGMVLIIIGVGVLAALPVRRAYRRAMLVVLAVAIAGALKAVQDHFIYVQPANLRLLFMVLGLAELVAMLLFCLAMEWFCETAHLPRAAVSWRVTLVLFTVVYVIPLGSFYAIRLVTMLFGEPFRVRLGWAAVPALTVCAVPILHLLVSARRMARESRERQAETPAPASDEPPADASAPGEESPT